MKRIWMYAVACPLLFACNSKTDESSKMEAGKMDSTSKMETSTGTPKDVEFADAKYMDMGRQQVQQLASGDVDGFASHFADNAVYIWSAGDSLAGKKAITDYWKNRRMNVIDSLSITNDIWLPIKVIKPQKGPDMPGTWLLGWYQFATKYKNGKGAGGWIHIDMHFDNNDKIDRLIQYIDRAPINAALGK